MFYVLRSIRKLFWATFIMLMLTSIFSAFATTNTISASGADDDSIAITPNDFRPPECTMNIQNLVAGAGNLEVGNCCGEEVELIASWLELEMID
jgi:hypothetical protein